MKPITVMTFRFSGRDRHGDTQSIDFFVPNIKRISIETCSIRVKKQAMTPEIAANILPPVSEVIDLIFRVRVFDGEEHEFFYSTADEDAMFTEIDDAREAIELYYYAANVITLHGSTIDEALKAMCE